MKAIAVKTAGTRSLFYVHTGHLGSLRLVINASKGIQTRYRYDAWGKCTLVAGAPPLSGICGTVERSFTMPLFIIRIAVLPRSFRYDASSYFILFINCHSSFKTKQYEIIF